MHAYACVWHHSDCVFVLRVAVCPAILLSCLLFVLEERPRSGPRNGCAQGVAGAPCPEIQASSVVAPFCARADLQRCVSCRHKSCLTRSATTPPSSSSASPGAPSCRLSRACLGKTRQPVAPLTWEALSFWSDVLVRLCAGGLSSGRVPSDSSGSASRPFTHPPTCLPDVPAWLPSLPGVPAWLPAQLQCFCALLLPSGLLSVCARLTVCANVIT